MKIKDIISENLNEDENKINSLIREIDDLISKCLPNGEPQDTLQVKKYKSLGGEYIAIKWSASKYRINGVRGQEPMVVSFMLDPETMELEPQVFGGNGGRRIYFRVKPEDNTHNALHGVTIPFRKPKRELKYVLKSLERFCTRWKQAIRKNQDRLPHTDEVNYDWV